MNFNQSEPRSALVILYFQSDECDDDARYGYIIVQCDNESKSGQIYFKFAIHSWSIRKLILLLSRDSVF